MTVKNQLEKGDWIRGVSFEGELIHGFIDVIEANKDLVKVYVVKSDHKEAIGKSIWIRSSEVKKLPLQTSMNEKQLQTLLDLALLTKDENWFMELSSKLKSIQTHSSKKNLNFFTNHRFGDPFQKNRC